MARMSRTKGATYERELVRDARAAGLEADRLAPLQAGRAAGVPDVLLHTYPELHVEAKRDERLSVDAMIRQAERDCATGRVPLVVYRRNRCLSRAVAPWKWLLGILAELSTARARVAELEDEMFHLRNDVAVMRVSLASVPESVWEGQLS